MRRLILLSLLLVPVSLFAQETVKTTGDIDDCKVELELVSKQLLDTRNQARSELKPLQDLVSSQGKDLQAAYKEIANLKAKNEDLQDKYSRLQAGTDALMQSPAYNGRVGVVDGGSSSSSYQPRSSHRTSQSRTYYTGIRGGCYYLTSSGRKQYVDRSLCN